jgi:exoribonuclease-2
VHQQIRAFVTGGTPQAADAVALRMATVETAGARIRRAERQSNLHWKLVLLDRTPGWRGDGVVVALEERKAVVMLPALGLETRLRRSDDMVLDQVLTLRLQSVDIAAQDVLFRVD